MSITPNGNGKSSAERILGIFNSWQQFGAVGVMAVSFCLVVGAGLYFIGKMINSSTAQHADDVKQYLTTYENTQRDLGMARNREMDAFVDALRNNGNTTTKSLETLTTVVKEQTEKNNRVMSELAEELRSNRATNTRMMEKATGFKLSPPEKSKKDG